MKLQPLFSFCLSLQIASIALLSVGQDEANAPVPDQSLQPPSFLVEIIPAGVSEADTTDSVAPIAAPEGENPTPDPIPIDQLLGETERATAFIPPTALLFISGYRLKFTYPTQTAPDESATPPPVGTQPSPPAPPPPAPAPTKPVTVPTQDSAPTKANPEVEAMPPTRGLVEFIFPANLENKETKYAGNTAAPIDFSIVIYDRTGQEMHFDASKFNDVIELKILRGILAELPYPVKQRLSDHEVRQIFDLIAPVTGFSLIEKNAGRLARVLDQVVLMKKTQGARSALVYIHGLTTESLFDDLKVSNLDLPLTEYAGDNDAPDGLEDLTYFPASIVIWQDRQMVKKYPLSQQDLIDLETSGKAKKILVDFLKLFPEQQNKKPKPSRPTDTAQQKDDARKTE